MSDIHEAGLEKHPEPGPPRRGFIITAILTGVFVGLLLVCPLPGYAAPPNYKNFDVAIYCRVYEVVQMKEPGCLESRWAAISKFIKVDKVYLETHRDMIVADQESIDRAKAFFLSKSVKVAGGITATVNEANLFQTFCYSNSEQRAHLKKLKSRWTPPCR